MNYYFIDEYKKRMPDRWIYGIVLVRINNLSYGKYKREFYNNLKVLGWDSNIEIKGHYSFSSSKGDKNVSIEDRLSFVDNLFQLSKSKSGKKASIGVHFTFEIFPLETKESKMYEFSLIKIINKLPMGAVNDIRNGKNNVAIYIDRNDCLDTNSLNHKVEDALSQRRLRLIEKCMFVDSDNQTPGIIFADHVAYFVLNYFMTTKFNLDNTEKVKKLVKKLQQKKKLTSKETEELNTLKISYKKETQSANFLNAIKKMELVI